MEATNDSGLNGADDKGPASKKGKWVVLSAGGSRYIGRIDSVNGVPYADNAVGKRVILDAANIGLKPAYDFFAPLQQVPGGGFQRSPIVVAADFTLDPTPVYVKPTAVIFFDDFTKEDREIYDVIIEDAEKQIEESRTQRRAHRSKLHLPKKSPLAL